MPTFSNMKYVGQFLESDMDFEPVIEKHVQKDVRDIKRAVDLECRSQSTRVVVIAVALDDDKNNMMFIPTGSGTAISQEVYDAVRDGFIIDGVSQFSLESIPVSYRLYLEGWEAEIPLPMSVVRRYLSDNEKKRLDEWMAAFPKEDYYFQTVQILEFF